MSRSVHLCWWLWCMPWQSGSRPSEMWVRFCCLAAQQAAGIALVWSDMRLPAGPLVVGLALFTMVFAGQLRSRCLSQPGTAALAIGTGSALCGHRSGSDSWRSAQAHSTLAQRSTLPGKLSRLLAAQRADTAHSAHCRACTQGIWSSCRVPLLLEPGLAVRHSRWAC